MFDLLFNSSDSVCKGIRDATKWYNKHISETHPPGRNKKFPENLPDVVLMTDDAENRRRATEEGISCVSGWDFYASFNR